MKKGTILITTGLLMILAAGGLVGYNLLQSYQAGERATAILEEIQKNVEEAADAGDSGEGSDEASADSSDAASDEASADSSNDSSDNAPGTAAEGTESDTAVNGGTSDSGAAEDTASDNHSADGIDENTADIIAAMYPEVDMPTCSVNEITYIGYISVPSLGITLPVQSEWQYSLLDISPARYCGSVYSNDLIIGGHSYITHFRALRNISIGANVSLTDAEGNVYNYKVAWTESLNPNQGEELVISESDQWDLTLFTCNTGGGTRCVVRCVRA